MTRRDWDLLRLAEQGKVQGFFNNAEDVDTLGGLVEDVQECIQTFLSGLP
jgi:hypothetical protein